MNTDKTKERALRRTIARISAQFIGIPDGHVIVTAIWDNAEIGLEGIMAEYQAIPVREGKGFQHMLTWADNIPSITADLEEAGYEWEITEQGEEEAVWGNS
jgi:hypothetical protein